MAAEYISAGGGAYYVVLGSDVDRDGMYLELNEEGVPVGNEVLVVFRSDTTGAVTFSAFKRDIPLDVVEWFLSEVRERLIEP